jgi:hypothetical protein
MKERTNLNRHVLSFLCPNTTNKNIKNFLKKSLMFSQKDAEEF